MRLSEAIRLGAMMGPQRRHALFGKDDNSTCAIGAALTAVDCHMSQKPASLFWPWLLHELQPRCPVCGQFSVGGLGYSFLLAHLNDDHIWTREQIADWVESVERGLSPEVGEATPQESEPVVP